MSRRDSARPGIHGWELGAIPGLLQTEDYARAMISSGRPNDTAEAVYKLVTARMDRQVILGRRASPDAVVRHRCGRAASRGRQP
ncbi:MAG TPA: Scr1 family TA system antitoxin-like transcriptional regulator, partial [Streptosporangiaceae bacterium]|nr:Scr1 family TA system antitoxin-like transcriptional regulator [Streptosporangiaceae bacterium]